LKFFKLDSPQSDYQDLFEDPAVGTSQEDGLPLTIEDRTSSQVIAYLHLPNLSPLLDSDSEPDNTIAET
jgi:hypothetical protein